MTFLAILGIGLLFVLSVAFITPPSANRALGIRIYLFFVWLASGIVMGIISVIQGDSSAIETWIVGMTLLFSGALFVSICERHELGPRVQRTIPPRRILRLPAFLLYSGAGGGICYSILMIVGTFIAATPLTALFIPVKFRHYSLDDALMVAGAFALYALGYSLTALSIRRIFFAKSPRRHITMEIMLVPLMAGEALPLIIGQLLFSGPWDRLPNRWYVGNPFSVFWEGKAMLDYMPFIGIWAVVVFSVTLPWLRRQYLNFKPLALAKIADAGPDDE
jgi:hypothetical protein